MAISEIVEMRRQRVFRLLLAGKSQSAIARMEGVTRETIRHDVKQMRKVGGLLWVDPDTIEAERFDNRAMLREAKQILWERLLNIDEDQKDFKLDLLPQRMHALIKAIETVDKLLPKEDENEAAVFKIS